MGRGILLLVSGFIVIFGIIQKAQQNREQVLAKRAPEYYYQEQSRNIAGAMLEIALGNINSGDNYLPQNVEQSVENRTIHMLGGVGKIKVEKMTNFKSTVYVKITGEIIRSDKQTAITTINAVFNRKAFSIYAYFTNYEPSNYVFVTGDVYNGPVHTNGRFNFLGDPVFNGPITSYNGMHDYNGRSNPEYNDIHNFNADYVKLPEDAPEVVELAKKEKGGIGQFDQEITLKFNGNGSASNNNGTVDLIFKNGNIQTYKLSDLNGVISSKENINVEGVIDGQVTLYSEKEIHITGDLVYENRNYNDKSELISDDMLGIISGGNTIIDKEAEYENYVKETKDHKKDHKDDEKDKGHKDDKHDKDHKDDKGHKDHGYGQNETHDIYVDASVLTMNGKFMAEDFDKRGRDRGTVHLLGGAIQRTAGAMGLVSGGDGHHLGGYSKNGWSYDTRFAENSTPGFPRKKRFEIENWRESTQVIPTDEASKED